MLIIAAGTSSLNASAIPIRLRADVLHVLPVGNEL
jgi:hypothetical protein